MNEQDFQQRIRQHLNMSARKFSPPIADRLLQARQQALSRQKQSVRRLSLAGIGQMLSEHVLPHGRMTLAMALVVLAALGLSLIHI